MIHKPSIWLHLCQHCCTQIQSLRICLDLKHNWQLLSDRSPKDLMKHSGTLIDLASCASFRSSHITTCGGCMGKQLLCEFPSPAFPTWDPLGPYVIFLTATPAHSHPHLCKWMVYTCPYVYNTHFKIKQIGRKVWGVSLHPFRCSNLFWWCLEINIQG